VRTEIVVLDSRSPSQRNTHSNNFDFTTTLDKMGYAFDKCKERPAQIDEILNGLNRYNPETTTTFQEYVNQQCEEKFFDAYASMALLKL
jgi:translation initiation factor 3 subunit K